MDAKIKNFVSSNHLLALSVLDNQQEIYTASCYYAFCEKYISLVFKSMQDCKHIQFAKCNPKVGVIIAEDSKKLHLIKGLQIKASFTLDILWAKYTDNTLLMEKKLIYQRNL